MSMSSSEHDKRRFQRVPFISNVQITLDGQSWQCGLLDISLKGLLIESSPQHKMSRDTLCSIALILSEDKVINMQAEVIHSENHHLGLQWVNIDLDSLTTLRQLLEINLSDARKINHELADLINN